jgi:predicted ferric reductase
MTIFYGLSPESLSRYDQFEITIRQVGVVTDFLFKSNLRAGLEARLQGFGGEFYVEQGEGETIAFVAAGVGITPLLAQYTDINLERLHLYWTVRSDDLALVNYVFEKIPGLAKRTNLFTTGKLDENSAEVKKLTSELHIQKRRMSKEDISKDNATKWYLCTGIAFRNSLTTWLEGRTTLYEDFNY